MMKINKFQTVILAFFICLSGQTQAEKLATIEALQLPVIIEREGSYLPAEPGLALNAYDKILTGKSARVLMRLADNSVVKLGENVEFQLKEKAAKSVSDTVYRATLDVIKGAFRFTTGVVNKYRTRDITARVKSVTIGIRGTDVWGKSEPGRDFVVLLEGNINIQRENETAVTMADPMTIFMAPTGQPTQAVSPVDQNELTIWAQETELQNGQGIIKQEGKYSLNLASYKNDEIAKSNQSHLLSQGYPTKRTNVTIDGQDWTRLFISGFSHIEDAEFIKNRLSNDFGYNSAWIIKN